MGSPLVQPEIDRAIEMARQIYQRNAAGCCLHIVLDDGELSSGYIDYCIRQARKAGHEDCLELALLLSKLSLQSRLKVYKAKLAVKGNNGTEKTL